MRVHPWQYILTTLENQVSDSQNFLAPSTAPISERIKRLCACFKLLRLRRGQHYQNTLFITYDWFEQAARVKRRALLENGDNHLLRHDWGRGFVAAMKDFFPDCEEQVWSRESEGQKAVDRHFLFKGQQFEFVVPDEDNGVSEDISESMVLESLETTLRGYEQELEGSWKRKIFNTSEDIHRVVEIPNKVR
ncbi:hypothetical protein BDP55DRAFT_416677 [Colletotrichum godetiae]|uniref:Uncharacterized protein n=1 Tax=Colletotrichum godetiae TaxID=1209918 RepID=A0AAJ0A7D7_9PEZI|nr:uncharacterized protein BDP55DRAFT_416677 [Colletotrichum godetiae]KAK1657845.1 hypothetical protein BDP55DRAFT_416677 [Colletotrichum godetiae]